MSVQEAKDFQRHFAPLVSCDSGIPRSVRHVAGVDVSPPGVEGTVRGAVVVLSYPDLLLEEIRLAEGRPGLPYVPGLLSFRETPVLVAAFERLELTPDIVIVDGHGFAHPRRFGLACHLGLLTDTPTVGCAKSILTGQHGPLGGEAGSRAELVDRNEVLGMAVRTRMGTRPVYVSVGHKVDLSSAVEWVLACCIGYRLPETTRFAHKAAAGGLSPGRWEHRATGRTSNRPGGPARQRQNTVPRN